MGNFLFYAATVLIWGTTWLAIKFQLGAVDPMVSVCYRFATASVLLAAWCFFSGLRMKFSPRSHLMMGLQGIFLFGVNYWLIYLSEYYLTSGLVAVLFSTVLVMNMVNGAIFLGAPIDFNVIAGGGLGLFGILLVFAPELSAFSMEGGGLAGVGLGLMGTFLASLGNIISAYNQKKGLPVLQTNAYGMGYGALAMLAVALLTGKTFGVEPSPEYFGSLLYLAVFGSIVAFGCYLTLVGRIGADRAAYATLLFPIVALAISTVLEGYRWSGSAAFGVCLILFGNLIMVSRGKRGKESEKSLPARFLKRFRAEKSLQRA